MTTEGRKQWQERLTVMIIAKIREVLITKSTDGDSKLAQGWCFPIS